MTSISVLRTIDASRFGMYDISMGQHPKICVYVIHDGEACKIGVASSPESRLAALQTGNPRLLELAYKSMRLPGLLAFAIEKTAHRQFADWRMQAEWFATDYETAIAFIEAEIASRIFGSVRVL